MHIFLISVTIWQIISFSLFPSSKQLVYIVLILFIDYLLKMGAKPTTITGLSGTGDIMLTCFVNLSRNRTVGVRLGSGEKLENILDSMNQVVSKGP